jgi:hypothetical protein
MPNTPRERRRRVPRTKLVVPELPAQLVSGPGCSPCSTGPASLVVLLSVQAGAGKTLLLAECARERGAGETAWVSLDSDDNDDRRFWSALLDALNTVLLPDGPLAGLRVPANPSLDGNHDLVRGVLDTLGARAVIEDSRLALVSALLHLEQGDPGGAERDLAHADAVWPDEPSAELVSLRHAVRWPHAQFAGDIDQLARLTEDLATPPGPHVPRRYSSAAARCSPSATTPPPGSS